MKFVYVFVELGPLVLGEDSGVSYSEVLEDELELFHQAWEEVVTLRLVGVTSKCVNEGSSHMHQEQELLEKLPVGH